MKNNQEFHNKADAMFDKHIGEKKILRIKDVSKDKIFEQNEMNYSKVFFDSELNIYKIDNEGKMVKIENRNFKVVIVEK